MAKKISELPYGGAVQSTDTLVAVRDGDTVRVDGAGNSSSLLVAGTPVVGNVLTASFPMGVGTVKWQDSPDGITWTDIGSAASMTFLVTAAQANKRVRPIATSYVPFGASVAVPPGPNPTMPRLLVIGPSTEAYNTAQDSQNRYGNSSNGPLTWANLLGATRLFESRVTRGTSGTYPYWTYPDNYATSGGQWDTSIAPRLTINQQVDQVVADIAAIPVGQRYVFINGGRNDFDDGMSAAAWQAQLTAALVKLEAVADRIFVPSLWKVASTTGGVWQSGGSGRTAVDTINAWLPGFLAARPKCVFIDLVPTMSQASGLNDPVVGFTTDGRHYTPKGAMAVGTTLRAVMTNYITASAMPARGAGLVPAFTGTGGSLANGATGVIPAGTNLTRGAAGDAMAVAGSVFDENGLTWTRLTLTPAATHSGGADLASFRTDPPVDFVIGTTYVMRARIRIPATLVPYAISFGLGVVTGTTRRAMALFATNQGGSVPNDNGTILDSTAIMPTDGRAIDTWIESPRLINTAAATGYPIITIIVNEGITAQPLVVELADFRVEVVA